MVRASLLVPLLGAAATTQAAVVDLKLDGAAPIAQTSENYICATMDWWPKEKCDYGICAWTRAPYGTNPSILEMDLSQPLFRQAVKTLSPFYLRLGGSLQDFINYDMTTTNANATALRKAGSPSPTPRADCPPMTIDPTANRWGFSGGCLNASRWEAMGSVCPKLGCKLVFGLNGLRGRKHIQDTTYEGKWDPSNARELLQYSKDHKIPLYAVELGNELGGWNGIAAKLAPEDVADDFVTLSDMVKEIWPQEASRPRVIGPDTGLDMDWYEPFLARAAPALNGVAIHLYALGAGVSPTLKQTIMNPGHTRLAEDTASNLTTLISSRQDFGGLEKWMGESGGAYNSGQNGTTNRFMGGFWSLSELSLFAKQGFSTYCRQTLLGGNYGLLDKDTLHPNPDFYNVLLFKSLMGPKVLSVEAPGNANANLRVYAHCTAAKAQGYKAGSVTLLALNFDPAEAYTIGAIGGALNQAGGRQDYLLTSSDTTTLNSSISLLNGQPLQLAANGAYPKLTPIVVEDVTKTPLTLPATSYGFFVFPDAALPACT